MTQASSTSGLGGGTARWAGGFLRANLDLWQAASAEPSGLFYPFLDRQWRRMAAGPLTLVAQCRLIYNFSRGFEIWRAAEYETAVRRGVAALFREFRVSPGRWRWALRPNGTTEDHSDAYGHAFVVLALATAGRALGEPSWVSAAWQTWQHVQSVHTDSRGGLVWRTLGPQPFDADRSQNPLMHGFEALMALHAALPGGDSRALDAARDVLAFVSRLAGFGAGALVEEFEADWQPKPAAQGGLVQIGHQFEWAWLLSEWHTLTGNPEDLAQGRRFLQTAVAWGLDADGGVREACAPDGTWVDAGQGLWPQCEAVRALHRYVRRHSEHVYADNLRGALLFYQAHFVDETNGGVFAGPAGAVGPAAQIKGDAWKLDYHTLGMCVELMQGKRTHLVQLF